MSDDPKKIVSLQTGYQPGTPPPTANEIVELNWTIALLKDEIEAQSGAMHGVVKALKIMSTKLDKLLERSKGD